MLKAERFRSGVWFDDKNGGHCELDSGVHSLWKANLAAYGYSSEEIDELIPSQKRSELMRQYAAKYRRNLKSSSDDVNTKLDFEMEYPPWLLI